MTHKRKRPKERRPQHTPPPWSLEPVDLIVYESDELGRTAIATVERRATADEWEANARLITAAPLLLAECERRLDDAKEALKAEEWTPDESYWESVVTELEEVIKRAR